MRVSEIIKADSIHSVPDHIHEVIMMAWGEYAYSAINKEKWVDCLTKYLYNLSPVEKALYDIEDDR